MIIVVKVGKWIAKHRFIILLLGILLLIPSFIGMAKTRINYDLLSYLPESLETVEGQDVMVDEYGMGAFAMVVVEDTDMKDIQKLADQFQSAWQDFAKDLDTAPTASERAKIDLEFHHQLVLTTENEYLIDMFETLQGTLHYLSIRSCEFVATEQKKDNLIVMGSQHVAICSAIGLGLPELARSAMERHIDFCCSRCLINRTFHAAGSR